MDVIFFFSLPAHQTLFCITLKLLELGPNNVQNQLPTQRAISHNQPTAQGYLFLSAIMRLCLLSGSVRDEGDYLCCRGKSLSHIPISLSGRYFPLKATQSSCAPTTDSVQTHKYAHALQAQAAHMRRIYFRLKTQTVNIMRFIRKCISLTALTSSITCMRRFDIVLNQLSEVL